MNIHHFWPEWSVVELIGKGSFGSVYKIMRKKERYVFYSALKVIRVPQTEDELRNLSVQGMDDKSIRNYIHAQVQALENEIVLMESVKSAANVVSIEDHYIERNTDRIGWTVYIRMELLESLNHYINQNGRLSKDETIKLGIDISNALASCEKTGIIHRDIKPANIFRNEYGDFKLGDFGISRRMEETEHASTRIGTPSYEAPEIVKGVPYNHTVDIYALGIVLYSFLNHGRKPFLPSYPQELYRGCEREAMERRISGEPFPLPDEADKELSAIILKACAFHPDDRFQYAADLRDRLNHYMSKTYDNKDDTISVKNPILDETYQDDKTDNFKKLIYNTVIPPSVREPKNLGGRNDHKSSKKWLVTAIASGVFIMAAIICAVIWNSRREDVTVTKKEVSKENKEEVSDSPTPSVAKSDSSALNEETTEQTATNTLTPGPTLTNTPMSEPTITINTSISGENNIGEDIGNLISGIVDGEEFTNKEKISFTAIGKGMDNNKPVEGDIRFVPYKWYLVEDTIWENPPYVATFKISKADNYFISVTFNQQKFNGQEWIETGEKDTKETHFTVVKVE